MMFSHEAYQEWLEADSDHRRAEIEKGARQEELLMNELAKREEKYRRRKREEERRAGKDLPF